MALISFGMMVFWQPAISVLESVSMIALQSSRESYIGLFASTFIKERFSQNMKAGTSMLFTLDGITMDTSLLQPRKASFLIHSVLGGSISDDSILQ